MIGESLGNSNLAIQVYTGFCVLKITQVIIDFYQLDNHGTDVSIITGGFALMNDCCKAPQAQSQTLKLKFQHNL